MRRATPSEVVRLRTRESRNTQFLEPCFRALLTEDGAGEVLLERAVAS
jgi:hypothetical protein